MTEKTEKTEKIPVYLFGIIAPGGDSNEPALKTIIKTVEKESGEVLNPHVADKHLLDQKKLVVGENSLWKYETDLMKKAKIAIGEVSGADIDDGLEVGYLVFELKIPILALKSKHMDVRRPFSEHLRHPLYHHGRYVNLYDLSDRVAKFMWRLKNGK